MYQRTVIAEAGKHRLHEPLSLIVTMLAFVQTGTVLRMGGNTNFVPGEYAAYECQVEDCEARIHTAGIVEQVIANPPLSPVGVQFGPKQVDYDVVSVPGSGKITSAPIGYITARVCFLALLEFYEAWRPWLEQTLGNDHTKFPADWRFARIVRNAASHNGVHISDPKFQPVTWRGLTYGPADNGRQILGTDLTVADVVLLIVDMSDALDQLRAPVV